jgi:hypothetical protein
MQESQHHPQLTQEKESRGSQQKQDGAALARREPAGQRRQHGQQNGGKKLGQYRFHAAEIL